VRRGDLFAQKTVQLDAPMGRPFAANFFLQSRQHIVHNDDQAALAFFTSGMTRVPRARLGTEVNSAGQAQVPEVTALGRTLTTRASTPWAQQSPPARVFETSPEVTIVGFFCPTASDPVHKKSQVDVPRRNPALKEAINTRWTKPSALYPRPKVTRVSAREVRHRWPNWAGQRSCPGVVAGTLEKT